MEDRKPKRQAFSTRNLVLAALFVAIIIVMQITNLGIIPITPTGISIVHIVVIIGALVLGPGYGAFFGFCFGLMSFLQATFNPAYALVGFAFSPFAPSMQGFTGNPLSLVVSFVPRILIGVFTPLVFRLLRKRVKHSSVAYGVSALVGSLTNTLLVLGFIFLFFGEGYAVAMGVARTALLTFLLGTVVTNGIPEAIAAVLVTAALGAVIDLQARRKVGKQPKANKEIEAAKPEPDDAPEKQTEDSAKSTGDS